MTNVILRLSCALSFVFAFSLSSPVLAAGGHGTMSAMSPMGVIGQPGMAAKVSRTVTVELRDVAFDLGSIDVKAGETIRFVLRNTGQLLHEFNIGTPDMHAAHQKEMTTMMEHGMLTPTGIDPEKMKMDMGGMTMKHDDPNSVLVEPGKSKEMIWTFGKAGAIEFACNIPGHYPAGMVGKFNFGR